MPHPETYLRFDLNENPYPLPDEVCRRISQGIRQSHCYPIALEQEVTERVARYFGVPSGNLVITNGIDECTDRLIMQFRGMRFVTTSPGFNGYWHRLDVLKQRSMTLERAAPDFQISEQDIHRITRDDFVLLANPDNPTGIVYDDETLQRLSSRCGRMLMDMAYVDYSDVSREMILGDDRVLYFRSFSKSFALAGFRLGALIGDGNVIRTIKESQWFCNINSLGLIALDAVLNNADWFEHKVELVLGEKARIQKELLGLGYRVRDTSTNFLVVETAGLNGLVEYLRQRKILVKDTKGFGMSGFIRCSIRTAVENERFLHAMNEYRD